jgi:type II secretory pathway component PulK
MPPERRRSRGERGASLIIALGFLALCGALIPAIVDLGGTNLADTARLQTQRSVIYAADGATDAAIQYLRLNNDCGRKFAVVGSCPLLPGNTFTTTIDGQTAAVAVAPASDTNPFDLDRKIALTTTVAGKDRVDAVVIFRDSSTNAVGTQPVDVKSWIYNR